MKLGAAHRGDRQRPSALVHSPEVAGYRLVARCSGPGEFWGAVGPGGVRAVLRVMRPHPEFDLVDLVEDSAARAIRHPNLQSCLGFHATRERLVQVLEWPDQTLWDRFREAVAAGHAGIPRAELLATLHEAARALDYLNGLSATRSLSARPHSFAGPGLSHGDIGPRSLLYIGGGIKVADLDPIRRVCRARGETVAPAAPLYPDHAAPERLAGRLSPHADQYSLALVYGHLLTGRPIEPRDLSALPAADRNILDQALHADPERRWPSSTALLDALRAATASATPTRDLFSIPASVLASDLTHPIETTAVAAIPTTSQVVPFDFRGAAAMLGLATVAASVALIGTLWLARPSRARAETEQVQVHRQTLAHPAPAPRVRLQNPND